MIASCEGGIRNRLKSSASAQMNLSVVSRFSVAGDVDAQNSYGGLMRNFWWCDFSVNGTLESVRNSSVR